MEKVGLIRSLIRLREFDRRRLSDELRYPSLFEYCVRELGLSKSDAGRRIAIVRTRCDLLPIVKAIESRALPFIGAAMLAPLITPENCTELLGKVAEMSLDEIAALAATRAPRDPKRDMIRPAAVLTPCPPSIDQTDGLFDARKEAPSPSAIDAISARIEPEPAPPKLLPAHRVSFDASDETIGMLKRARELLRHRVPLAQLDSIFKLALRALLRQEDRDLRVVTRSARKPGLRAKPPSRRIPESVRQAVWERDGGRCVQAMAGGERCRTRAWLEFDHVVPWSCGGRSDDPGNIRLLCRAHNQLRVKRAPPDAELPLRPCGSRDAPGGA